MGCPGGQSPDHYHPDLLPLLGARVPLKLQPRGGHSAQWGHRRGPRALWATGSGELGLASVLRPWPALPTATWLTGFPPCLGHELTSAPLTGKGGGCGQGTSHPLCRVPTLPVPQDNGRDSASGHSWWGGGGHEHEEGRREGSRAEDHLGPQPPSSRTWLMVLQSPSAQLSGLKGGRGVEGGGSFPPPGPSLL